MISSSDTSKMRQTGMGCGVLEISRAAIQDNYRIICNQLAPGCIAAPAVKADAYGLGIEASAPALYDVGARSFFVANLDEGIALRQILSAQDDATNIAVLGGPIKNSLSYFDEFSLTPVINTFDQYELAKNYSKRSGSEINCILQIDTGMNRLGFKPYEIENHHEDLSQNKEIKISCIMSHFACADEKDHPKTVQQHQIFERAVSFFDTKISRSLCNSSGLFRDKSYQYNITRPGMALYGLNPTPEQDNPMRNVVQLSVPILQIHTGTKTETCGYGASHLFKNNTALATIALGYADGFFRSLGNAQSQVFWDGTPCPIIGRVSMDLCTVSLEHIPESARPKVGDRLEVLGENQSADALAAQAETIGYEVLTALGGRYARHYI